MSGIVASVLWAGFVLGGCGYHLQGSGGSSLPPHIKKIFIPIFDNNTLEQGIEVRVTDAIRKVLIDDGRVSVAGGIADADAVLTGSVMQFQLRPIGFSSGDRAQEFRLRITLRASLRDLENQKILFRQTIVTDREFRVSANLSSNEQAQTEASRLASESIAQELRGLMIEGF